jgi:hypothetical protein
MAELKHHHFESNPLNPTGDSCRFCRRPHNHIIHSHPYPTAGDLKAVDEAFLRGHGIALTSIRYAVKSLPKQDVIDMIDEMLAGPKSGA